MKRIRSLRDSGRNALFMRAQARGHLGPALIEFLESRCLLSAIPLGGEFKVNTNPNNNQGHSSVAMDGAGNSVVVWIRLAEGTGAIFGQRYDQFGGKMGEEFRISTYDQGSSVNWQFASPAVAVSDSGIFVVTWIADGEDGSGGGIYAQRYNKYGVAQGDEFKVNTYTDGNQVSPAVAMDNAGNFAIAWQGDDRDGSGTGIFAQRYDAAGNSLGGEFQVNATPNNDQVYPTIAMDGAGDFVIAWQSLQDGHDFGIYAQRYNASGMAQGNEFQVNSSPNSGQGFPAVAMDDSGNFVVTWDTFQQDGSGFGIGARRYDASGGALGNEFKVNTFTDSDQLDPAVAMDKSGDFVVAWTSDGEDGSGDGIYAQGYNAAGDPQGGEFRVNSYTDGFQESAAVAMDNVGKFIITWDSARPSPSGAGIYAQRYAAITPHAAPVFGDLPAVMTVPENASSPYAGGYYTIPIPVIDADTPQTSLHFSVDSATPPRSDHNYMPFFADYFAPGTARLWVPICDGPYQQTINMRVTDDAGLSATRTLVLNVLNVPPQVYVNLIRPPTLNPLSGQDAQFGIGVDDNFFAGRDNTEAWWDFGDGVVTSPQPVNEVYSGVQTFFLGATITHRFQRYGNFTVKAFVHDDDDPAVVVTQTFSVTVAPYGVDPTGVLRVGGTTGNDNYHVSPAAGGKTNLFMGGGLVGVFAANSVAMYGDAGDDVLDAADTLTIPVESHGGSGNDLLRGGRGNDLLFGEGGNDGLDSRDGADVLVGGDGNDIAYAGNGNDVLIGSLGNDSLYGQAGNDILIGGYTDWDTQADKLTQIVTQWNLPGDYATRTAAIRASFLAPNVNVHDSRPADDDYLTGGTYGVRDQDYFFGNVTRTRFADRSLDEKVESLV